MAKAKLGSKLKIKLAIKDEKGEDFQKTEDEADEIVLGEGLVVPGVEVSLVGMSPGDKKNVELKPEMHYGPRNEDLVFDIEKEGFNENIKLEKDQTLEYTYEDGTAAMFRVTEIDDKKVKLDGNHPLAGQTISVDIELVDVE